MVFTFGDDTSPIRSGGRKHRRGRGHTPNRDNTSASAANNNNNATASSGNSYRQGGHKLSNAASRVSSRVSSLTGQTKVQQRSQGGQQQQQQQPQAYVTSDAWDNPNSSSITSSKSGQTNSNNQPINSDNNSCAGSLTYSASSSVQSAESSGDSSLSFSKIMDVIDKEGEGARDVKEFMAKQSKAAIGNYDACGGGQEGNAAVQGWNQRRAQQIKQQQAAAQQKSKKTQSKNHQPLNFSMSKQHMPLHANVDLNYSKDDSSEDDVFGVDFDENIVLETIAGLDDDIIARPSSQSPSSKQNPFRNNNSHHQAFDPFQTSTSPNNSAPSSPRSRSNNGHITPPPNYKQKRTSTPPDAHPMSRTNSRHSKSSSDGSFDTPAPSSPPHHTSAMMAHHSSSMKPPHARSTPVSKTRRGSSMGTGKREDTVVDEAFYAKSWMCGFADAFNFDGFEKFKE
mmetsp:Transcript_27154/g.58174  ORF Transcript_27154/g.58174 Transcript_27154/m.58174 type:complete len:453 (+) Transcript_27154:557-1915(+)|eukprot:CAMPEP_0172316234 /NCGR_PEP_ID=MMETSP1058-20130122/27554_1 /TAXON_ID=83371 /ORGANISM="Detonula confervacea, Strain CCMP 353" /LENGTH=452 /DNA_ID=CAMNT_0013030501 /DNA_START=508 /DNA_END=1866 /DNA_ORIENTATION=+